MDGTIKIGFEQLKAASSGSLILFMDDGLKLGATAQQVEKSCGGAIARAAAAMEFKGKKGAFLTLPAPGNGAFTRILVVGVGKAEAMTGLDWLNLGGAISAHLPAGGTAATQLLCETAKGPLDSAAIAEMLLGARLGAYRFDRYKTKYEGEAKPKAQPAKLAVAVADVAGAKKADQARLPVYEGVILARDLVNLPANDLGPVEFAKTCQELTAVGVKVEVLTEKEMSKLGMRALLGVGQGSVRGSRLVVMHWNGAKPAGKPLAFVGKGVVFDTGGISIKPAQNMEDMKGDMAGAACVTGLMHALAKRKAKANVVGIVGLVENMPSGNAQRPGDVVKSMSGQTIEIINTDAEGRLVLADALWYCQHRFKPRFMIDLATLTGAVLVALGQEHAGLFSNDDKLAAHLLDAAAATEEKLWRLPLSKAYDKIIDSKIADVKNSGGRLAGSITAAQFLQRFVNDTPWAHLDIAGTGMAVHASDINRSWGPGFGVRLLDRLVADHYEV